MIPRKLALGAAPLLLIMVPWTTFAADAPAVEKAPATVSAIASTVENTPPKTPAAVAPTTQKAPAPTALAAGASTAGKASPQSKLAALVAASRAAPKTAAQESFDRYQVLISNNIFVRDRKNIRDQGSRSAETVLGPEEATVLRGVVHLLESPGAPYFAYFEDVRTGATVKVGMGDPICQGKLANPTLDSVEYVKNGVTKRIEIGRSLTGAIAPPVSSPSETAASDDDTNRGFVRGGSRNGADMTGSPQSPTTGSASASTALPLSPEAVLEQMRQKRLKALGK